MYQKLSISPMTGEESKCVNRISDGAHIPFEPSNTDYQKFKSDIESGSELQDSDGNVMSQDQVNEFLSTLP